MHPRLLIVVIGLVTALVFPTVADAAFQRCCFRVDTDVSGQLTLRYGDGPVWVAHGDHQFAWQWSVRQIARYGEKGEDLQRHHGHRGRGSISGATGGAYGLR